MLSPCTAPRWNTAMSTLGRASVPWAEAVRRRKGGIEPIPRRARAPALMNDRRVQQRMALSPLELGRAQHERGELLHVRVGGAAVVGGGANDLRIVELGGEHGPRLRGGLAVEH